MANNIICIQHAKELEILCKYEEENQTKYTKAKNHISKNQIQMILSETFDASSNKRVTLFLLHDMSFEMKTLIFFAVVLLYSMSSIIVAAACVPWPFIKNLIALKAHTATIQRFQH